MKKTTETLADMAIRLEALDRSLKILQALNTRLEAENYVYSLALGAERADEVLRKAGL